jgi:hypothetical protein
MATGFRRESNPRARKSAPPLGPRVRDGGQVRAWLTVLMYCRQQDCSGACAMLMNVANQRSEVMSCCSVPAIMQAAALSCRRETSRCIASGTGLCQATPGACDIVNVSLHRTCRYDFVTVLCQSGGVAATSNDANSTACGRSAVQVVLQPVGRFARQSLTASKA